MAPSAIADLMIWNETPAPTPVPDQVGVPPEQLIPFGIFVGVTLAIGIVLLIRSKQL
jgi:hypothetical protein